MKRLIKRGLRPVYRGVGALMRPLLRRADARLANLVSLAVRRDVLPTIQGQLEASTHAMGRLEGSIHAANHSASIMANDMDVLLESVVRELARLQSQVDAIEDSIHALGRPGRSSLTLVEGDEEGLGDGVRVDRVRVG